MEAAPSPNVAQAVVLRLYPNLEQAAQMRQWNGVCRALWNHLVGLQKERRQRGEKYLTAKELEQERQIWEHEPDCAWRQAPQSHARQRVAKLVAAAISKMFADQKAGRFQGRKPRKDGMPHGFPRFKRKGPGGAFYVANTRLEFDPATRTAKLAKLGAMKVRGGRMPSPAILGAVVSCAGNRWSLSVQFEAPPPRIYGEPSRPGLGIDVGLVSAVVRSDAVVNPARGSTALARSGCGCCSAGYP
jgi:transposase